MSRGNSSVERMHRIAFCRENGQAVSMKLTANRSEGRGKDTDFTDFTDGEKRQHGGPHFWHSTDNVKEPVFLSGYGVTPRTIVHKICGYAGLTPFSLEVRQTFLWSVRRRGLRASRRTQGSGTLAPSHPRSSQ